MYIDSGYLVIATSHIIKSWSFWNSARFLPGLQEGDEGMGGVGGREGAGATSTSLV